MQERLAKAHGTQCGFCTPGFVMSMYALLRNDPTPSWKTLIRNFQGNLCRCTGYRPIMDGFKTFTEDFQTCMRGQCPGGSGCCKGDCGASIPASSNHTPVAPSALSDADLSPFDPTQEPTFPAELQIKCETLNGSRKFTGRRLTWFRPANLAEAMKLKAEHPHAVFVSGFTKIALDMKTQTTPPTHLIAIGHVQDLASIEWTDAGVTVGASMTFNDFENLCRTAILKHSEHPSESKMRMFHALLETLQRYGSQQIRNVARLGGAIAFASSTSDIAPVLHVIGCSVTVFSTDGHRRILPIDESFYLETGKSILEHNELILSLHIPFSKKDQYMHTYKQARRRDCDIAAVTCGFKVEFDEGVIKNIILCYGGVAPSMVIAKETSKHLIGRRWDEDMLSVACECLNQELVVTWVDNQVGAMLEYKQRLITGLFFMFYMRVLNEVQTPVVQAPIQSARSAGKIERGLPKGSQVYEVVDSNQPADDPIGRPLVHMSALEHATGEALYCDDIPPLRGELFAGLVTSTRAHARVVSIDTQTALATSGVVCFVDHRDIPGKKYVGPVTDNEAVFAVDEVESHGHIIGCVVAESRETAREAAATVTVEYEDLPAIFTIEEAIANNSFYGESKIKTHGDVAAGFKAADAVLEGTLRMGGQQHFYLEPQSCICVPGEKQEMNVYISTQSNTNVQNWIAATLAIPANRIVCHQKRVGGAFGGKEVQCSYAAIPAAVAAYKTGKPVRLIHTREEDLSITGARLPMLANYKVGCNADGKIVALQCKIYLDAGRALSLSDFELWAVFLATDGCFRLPNLHIEGICCKTNLPSNTAFRGFGQPQGQMLINWILSAIAEKLELPYLQVIQSNLRRQGDVSTFNSLIESDGLHICIEECRQMSHYEHQLAAVNEFNKKNRFRKQGISLQPCIFGFPICFKSLNQAGALVHVYTDGSVLLAFGGCEIGQGLFTKMIQVASRALQVSVDKIHVSETSSDKVPNSTSTGGSMTSDHCGGAVLNACQILRERIDPFKERDPSGTWEDWVKAAYLDRVSLSTTGFFRPDGLEGYDFETHTGNPYNYHTFGAACSQVEIDCVTGDHVVLRTDIVMDVGKSLNPMIDIGQIEGAFVQGCGLLTLEELRYTADGFLSTRHAGNYKIPGIVDVPEEFNVALLRNSENPCAIYSSKGIGEPPLLLASTVFFAIKNAVRAAREQDGLSGSFQFDSPATVEKILLACPSTLLPSTAGNGAT
ncbi:PREDICTED: xanthine dehydrogenase/oxidase-like [Priapulus caudatus]|uniref:Xanthine dehydrogenase/oxidase-like n=1 Tax=Priapulus caudatus TaxID=37621 RepID=A0ABM1EQ07_PRICU|nr:PREDICTED: xanthine dehydrogenase/oxidase-like [Priapulus caudatus]